MLRQSPPVPISQKENAYDVDKIGMRGNGHHTFFRQHHDYDLRADGPGRGAEFTVGLLGDDARCDDGASRFDGPECAAVQCVVT